MNGNCLLLLTMRTPVCIQMVRLLPRVLPCRLDTERPVRAALSLHLGIGAGLLSVCPHFFPVRIQQYSINCATHHLYAHVLPYTYPLLTLITWASNVYRITYVRIWHILVYISRVKRWCSLRGLGALHNMHIAELETQRLYVYCLKLTSLTMHRCTSLGYA